VATPSTKSAAETVTDTVTETVNGFVNEIPALAQKSREQVVSGLQQGQQLSVDAAQSWVKAVSALPVMDLPKIPGMPSLPDLDVATRYAFDVATDLLNAQRDFVVQLGHVLVPAKTS